MVVEKDFRYQVEYPDPQLGCSISKKMPRIRTEDSCQRSEYRTVRTPKWIWKFIGIVYILMILAMFLGGCADIALATELTASYYTTSGLIKDGQWAITHGKMANGKVFDDMGFTVASCDFPLGTRLHITRGSKSVAVTVTDRTNRRFKGKRIDLTPAVFKKLSPSGTTKEGLIKVTVTEIGGK